MRPRWLTTPSTTSLTASEIVTSQAKADPAPPSPCMIPTVSCAASRFTSTQATWAPLRANRTAVAFPLPHPGPTEPAPNRIATLPSRRFVTGTPERAVSFSDQASSFPPEEHRTFTLHRASKSANLHRARYWLGVREDEAALTLLPRDDRGRCRPAPRGLC